MNPKTIIAVILVTLGIVVLAYSGITFKTPGKPVEFLGMHIETTDSHFVPPVAGALALQIGHQHAVVLATQAGGAVELDQPALFERASLAENQAHIIIPIAALLQAVVSDRHGIEVEQAQRPGE